MLDQLYFTWSDKGLGGITGFRVRAASDGVSDIAGERYNSFKPYLNYTLPQGTDAYAASTEKSPYSLIFADTGKERVLAQQVYSGRDGYNRPGVYFVHLIAGLTGDFLACDAIDLWRSTSFWDIDTKRMRDANSVRLDQVSPMALKQNKGSLSEHAIETVQQSLPWLIQAYLTVGDTQKIYIAAPNEHVAALIWGLAHSLPRVLQASLTFSIYEFDVLKAPERIIGTSQSESELLKGYIKSAQILPTECYSAKAISIDCYSGKTSDLKYVAQEIVDYSLFATDRFVKRRKKDLDDLLTTAEQLNVKNINEFLAIFKFYASFTKDKPLTEQEITGLLGNGDIVTAVLPRENVQRAIIDLAIANLTWWNEQAAPTLTSLRKGFDQRAKEALAQFGMQVARDLCTALLSHQTKACSALMLVLFKVTPPNTDSRPWIVLLESLWKQSAKDKSFQPAKAYSWEVRAWLLEQWAFGSQVIKEEHIKPWLHMSWSELEAFLAIPNIPFRWCQLAIIELLTTSKESLPKDTITLLIKNKEYMTIFVNALSDLMSSPQTLEAALHGFARVATDRDYPHKIWLLATLLGRRELSSQELDAFLQAAQLDSKEKITLLEEHCQVLLPPKSKTPASAEVVDLLKTYLNKFSLDKLLKDPSPHTFAALEYLSSQSKRIPDGLATQIWDWLLVSDGIMHEPFAPLKIEAKSLKLMGEAIAHLKVQDQKKYRESLFHVLINSIKTNNDLHCVYESFTPTLASTKKELLYELAAFIGERYNPNMAYNYLLPYIAEALAYSLNLQALPAKEKFLKPLLEVLLQNADEATFKKIEGEVKVWPKAYREEWQQYAPAPKKGILQKVGDVGGIFIGVRRLTPNPPGNTRGKGIQHNQSGQPPNPNPQNQPQPPNAQGWPPPPQKQSWQQVPTSNTQQQQLGNATPQNQDRSSTRVEQPSTQQNGGSYSNQNQYLNASPNIASPQYPQREQYAPPNNAQQHGGYQVPGTPYQNSPMMNDAPTEASPARSYAPNNAPIAAPQPQSIVNGKPIYPEQIRAVFTLKGPYIDYRRNELNEIFKEYSKAKKDTTWIPKERDELDYHSGMGIEYTLEALEHDILINDALEHFGIDSAKLLEEVYKKVKGQYKNAFGNQYSEKDIKNVLLVFVHYRLLSEHLRNQMSMKDWLIKQQPLAQINRSSMPLPTVQ